MGPFKDEHKLTICQLDGDEIVDLTSNIKLLSEKVDALITLNRDVIKWLLIVVSLIALGRSAIDIGKDMIRNYSSHATVVTQ